MSTPLTSRPHYDLWAISCLLVGLVLLPVEQAYSQSIVTDGDIVGDGISLRALTNSYCEHLVTEHSAGELPDVCLNQVVATRFVFTTSRASTLGGNMVGWANSLTSPAQPFTDGLTAADAICQFHADDAGLGGTYKAWLSTDTVDAKDRIGNFKWVLPDATTVVANNRFDLLNCDSDCLQNPINQTEFSAVSADVFVHTSTQTNGTYEPGPSNGPNNDCSDWTSNDAALSKGTGNAMQKNNSWTNNFSAEPCNYLDRLFCFQN